MKKLLAILLVAVMTVSAVMPLTVGAKMYIDKNSNYMKTWDTEAVIDPNYDGGQGGGDPEPAVSVAGANLQPPFRTAGQDEGMGKFSGHPWDRQGIVDRAHEKFQFRDSPGNALIHPAPYP